MHGLVDTALVQVVAERERQFRGQRKLGCLIKNAR